MALPVEHWKPVAQPLPWRGFSIWVTVLLLAISDTLALTLAALVGFRFWELMYPVLDSPYDHAWAVIVLGAAVNTLLRLYPGAGLGPVETLRRTTLSCTIVHLLLNAALVATSEDSSASRGAFLISWLLAIVLMPSGRALMTACFARRSWWGVPVIVLGAGHTGKLVLKQARENLSLGLKPVACFDDDPAKQGVCEGVPVLGTLKDAVEFSRTRRVGYAIVAMPGVARHQLMELLGQWSTVFSHVVVIPNLFGMTTLGISPLDLGGVLGLEIRYNLLNPVNRWCKRVVDLLFAALLAVLVIPLLLLCALCIVLVSPGPVLFTQEREGERGRKIKVYKLRTMFRDAEQLLEAHLARDPAAREEWDRFCKLKKDPRVLPGVGNLLRRTSLDELPQLWNIILGEMSLVGPRPFPAYHNARFDPAFRDLRLRVTPGLTGLWQVSARSDGDLEVQAELDSYYIRNWSIWLDAHILVRTAGVVLLSRGAY